MANLEPRVVVRETWGPLLTAPADGSHLVHFYEDDVFLADVVSKFLGAGLDAGDRLVVIATPEHRKGFLQRLQNRGVHRAIVDGRLLLLDARETLPRLMVQGRPDAGLFHRVLDDALRSVGGGMRGVRTRVYGEMVDLLWRDGECSAAMALEELWNNAASRQAFSRLCAYAMANFSKGGEGVGFVDVCRAHGHVLASERAFVDGNGADLIGASRRELDSESASEQRHAAWEAHLASEERFHHLVDAVTDYAIFMLDSTGCVATWNAGAEKIKGYHREEILGQHFSVFYVAQDRATAKPQRILETVRREGRFEDENWRVRKDGSLFWANVVITALRDQRGEITGFAKVTRALPARREAESRAPPRLETVLLEIVDAAIDIAEADFCDIELLSSDGSDLQIVAHRGFPRWWLDSWSSVSSGRASCGTPLQCGRRVIVEDVELSPLFVGTPALEALRRAGIRAVISTPIVSRSGGPLGMFSTHYRIPHAPEERTLRMLDVLARQTADIIDRARADAADAALRRQLEEANRAKDEFVATMSHELRTPLNAVLGWVAILRHDHDDQAKLQQGLEVIERNARAQTRLVNDLLDVSRIISGKLRLSMQRAEVSGVIYAAADVVRPVADAKRVRLVLDLDPDVGAINADPDRLQQMIWNLLSNAVRFTPPGGRVVITAYRDGPQISICVRDTGSGISAEHLPHIFERFRQFDSSTTRAHGGLGLGLTIVRHLVEAHGGNVLAASEGPGRGATFTINLPIPAVTVLDPELPTKVDAENDVAPQPKLGNVRALVVDDHADSLELVRLVLEGAGATVTTAASGEAALRAPGPFDIIISDIAMPEMDGYAFMTRIRSDDTRAATPAIALTAYARPEDVDQAARSGYQEHFTKPVDAVALIEAVERWANAS